jgi:hemoglobin
MARTRTLACAWLTALLSSGLYAGAAMAQSAAVSAQLKKSASYPQTIEAHPAPGSLYERLGGTQKVTAFVNETIDRVAADPRMNQSFDKVDLKRVKILLVQQICSLTEGGCTYSGDPMKEVHEGHKITNAEFFDLVEVLRKAMRSQDVPLSARNELLAILAPMKRDVVER